MYATVTPKNFWKYKCYISAESHSLFSYWNPAAGCLSGLHRNYLSAQRPHTSCSLFRNTLYSSSHMVSCFSLSDHSGRANSSEKVLHTDSLIYEFPSQASPFLPSITKAVPICSHESTLEFTQIYSISTAPRSVPGLQDSLKTSQLAKWHT